MRTRPAPRPGVHALPQPAGDGRRHRLVQGRGLRGRRKAGVRRALRLRAPRHGATAPGAEVPPHRRGPAQARRRRGHGPRRAGAPLARLGPVAAQPDGAPGRRGIDLRHSLRRLRRGVPRPLPLVPLHPPGRRHDPSRREDRGRRQAGDSPPTGRASPSASGGCATGRCPERCSSSRPTRCGSGTREGRSRPPTHRRCWPSNAMRSRPERATRCGARPGRRIRRPALRPRPGRPRRRAAGGSGTRTGRPARRPARQGSRVGPDRPDAARHAQARREARPRPHLRLALDHPQGAGRADGRHAPEGHPTSSSPWRGSA